MHDQHECRRSWPARDADHLLITAAQMAALEAQLFASGLPVEALMEKAGLALARRLLALFAAPAAGPVHPEACDQPGQVGSTGLDALASALRRQGALVLVGPGHNGGDGLVVARELHLAGVPVSLWSPYERRKPLTERHWQHARWLGIPVLSADPDPAAGCLWIDALFGNGQHRPPEQELQALLERRQRQRPDLLVAIDIPTGLCSDSGRPLSRVAARAALTLSLGLIRQGLVQDAARGWVGQLERVDLGLPAALLSTLPAEQPLGLAGPGREGRDPEGAPRPQPPDAAAKYARGRVLVIAGSDRYPGAAHLCLAGASASGCGSIRAVLPPPLAERIVPVLPHVVLEPPPFTPASLRRLDALLVGPGLGPPPTAGDGGGGRGGWPEQDDPAFWRLLQGFEGTLLLDADGLNRISADWLPQRAGRTWITPHAAEFARLFGDLAALPPLQAAAAAARRSGAAVLLKGAHSVVASPDGRCWQVLRSCPVAARAGLGDVLAGYAVGLAARAAACGEPDDGVLAVAALDHALAGCRAARLEGEGGATPAAVARALQRPGSG